MGKQDSNPILCLSTGEILLYLIFIPFAFTGTIHFISSQSEEVSLSEEIRFVGEMSAARSYLLNVENVRQHMLFKTDSANYLKFAETNHQFNYTLPILGERLMKVIKTKEEVSFNEATDRLETVTTCSP